MDYITVMVCPKFRAGGGGGLHHSDGVPKV